VQSFCKNSENIYNYTAIKYLIMAKKTAKKETKKAPAKKKK
jgi:hypothetical protein